MRGNLPGLVFGLLADGRLRRCHGGNARNGSDDLQPKLDRALGVLGADSAALERDRLRVDRVLIGGRTNGDIRIGRQNRQCGGPRIGAASDRQDGGCTRGRQAVATVDLRGQACGDRVRRQGSAPASGKEEVLGAADRHGPLLVALDGAGDGPFRLVRRRGSDRSGRDGGDRTNGDGAVRRLGQQRRVRVLADERHAPWIRRRAGPGDLGGNCQDSGCIALAPDELPEGGDDIRRRGSLPDQIWGAGCSGGGARGIVDGRAIEIQPEGLPLPIGRQRDLLLIRGLCNGIGDRHAASGRGVGDGELAVPRRAAALILDQVLVGRRHNGSGDDRRVGGDRLRRRHGGLVRLEQRRHFVFERCQQGSRGIRDERRSRRQLDEPCPGRERGETGPGLGRGSRIRDLDRGREEHGPGCHAGRDGLLDGEVGPLQDVRQGLLEQLLLDWNSRLIGRRVGERREAVADDHRSGRDSHGERPLFLDGELCGGLTGLPRQVRGRGRGRVGERHVGAGEIRLDRFRAGGVVERVRFGRGLRRSARRDRSAEEGRENIRRRRGAAGGVELVGVVALAADDVLDAGRGDDLVGVGRRRVRRRVGVELRRRCHHNLAARLDHEREVGRHVAEIKLGLAAAGLVGGLVDVDLDQLRRRGDVDAPPGVVKVVGIGAGAPFELLHVGDVGETRAACGDADADGASGGQRLRSEIDRQARRDGRQIERVGALVRLFRERDAREFGRGFEDVGVVTGVAGELVGAACASESVLPRPADEDVGSGSAGERVVLRAADERLDVREAGCG